MCWNYVGPLNQNTIAVQQMMFGECRGTIPDGKCKLAKNWSKRHTHSEVYICTVDVDTSSRLVLRQTKSEIIVADVDTAQVQSTLCMVGISRHRLSVFVGTCEEITEPGEIKCLDKSGNIKDCHPQYPSTSTSTTDYKMDLDKMNVTQEVSAKQEELQNCYIVKQDVWTHCMESGKENSDDPQCSINIARKAQGLVTVSVSVNTPTLVDVTSETHRVEQKCTNRCDIDINSNEIVSVTCGYKIKARFITPQNILNHCPFIYSSFHKEQVKT